MHDELKRRLRGEIGAQLGSRPPSDLSEVLRRGHRKQLGIRLAATVAMIVIGSAAFAGGLWIDQTVSSPSEDGTPIQPAEDETSPFEPTPSETPENAELSGARIDLLDGEVTFRRTRRWEEQQEFRMIREAPMGPESLLLLGNPRDATAAFLVIADPAPLQRVRFGPPVGGVRTCSRTGATVVSAEVLADAVRNSPGLSSTDPVAERVAGIDALRLDLAASAGATTCAGSGVGLAEGPTGVGVPVITGTRDTALGTSLAYVAEEGKRLRLYLLDPPAGSARTLAIVIVAAEEDFTAAVEAARPILDSFEFRASQQEHD